MDVTVFERNEHVGGNANTHEFDLSNGGRVRVGLSVLAWPAQLFRHYEALLARLTAVAPRVRVRLPFVVQESSSGRLMLNQTVDSPVHPELLPDLQRWIPAGINITIWASAIMIVVLGVYPSLLLKFATLSSYLQK